MDVYCADDEKWSDFEAIRPAAELRQFAARALRLIERAIMANFREGVWVATARRPRGGRETGLLAPSLQIWCLLCARFVTAEGEGKENMLAARPRGNEGPLSGNHRTIKC